MPKRTEEEIMFPEQTIGGIVVKPWSFGQLFKISAPLEKILDHIEESGFAEKLINPNGDIDLNYLNLARLFTIAGPELLTLISVTLSVPEDKVKKLSIQDGISIILLMYYQNKEMVLGALKNAFSPPQPETKLKKAIKAKEEKKAGGQKKK